MIPGKGGKCTFGAKILTNKETEILAGKIYDCQLPTGLQRVKNEKWRLSIRASSPSKHLFI